MKHCGAVFITFILPFWAPNNRRLPSLHFCSKRTAAPWFLCLLRAEPDQNGLILRPCSVCPSPCHRSVLTRTHSLGRSQASGAPLLFWPTRKSPRQATPPPRHREQQRAEIGEGRESRRRKWPETNEVGPKKHGVFRQLPNNNDERRLLGDFLRSFKII